MAKDEWFDPRLTVFVIWGIFVVLFIVVPSRHVVQKIFAWMGCRCCAYEEEIVPSSTVGNGRERSYESLSNARKQEIDSLRASHLTYRMHQFSMTLEEKDMLRRVSVTLGSLTDAELNVCPVPQDRISNEQGNSHGDVEAGIPPAVAIDSTEHDGEERKEEENKEEEDAKYTHISIPEPGHNAECVDVHELMARAEAEKNVAEKKPREVKKGRIRLFGRKAVKEEANGANGDKEDIKTLGDAKVKKGRRRSCPLFCAICLQQYEPSERVSWSSNPECTHAFHEDCVVQWLVSLGRTKAKRQRFADDPTEAQLLNYELECPCCRQEFISRGQAELPEVCGEERV